MTPVQHGLHSLSFEHPDFEPERCGGLVVQWQAIPSETQVGQQHLPVDLDGKVSILAHSCPKVHINSPRFQPLLFLFFYENLSTI